MNTLSNQTKFLKKAKLFTIMAGINLTFLGFTEIANAASVTTTSFQENKERFRWEFTWDFSAPEQPVEAFLPSRSPNQECNIGGCWDVQFFIYQGFRVQVLGRHLTHPDDHPDTDPGGLFLSDIVGPGIFLTATTGEATLLVRGQEPHISTPRNHTDFYSLSFTRNSDRSPVNFTFVGIHQVPEPSSILGFLALSLWGTGSAINLAFKHSKK